MVSGSPWELVKEWLIPSMELGKFTSKVSMLKPLQISTPQPIQQTRTRASHLPASRSQRPLAALGPTRRSEFYMKDNSVPIIALRAIVCAHKQRHARFDMILSSIRCMHEFACIAMDSGLRDRRGAGGSLIPLSCIIPHGSLRAPEAMPNPTEYFQ